MKNYLKIIKELDHELAKTENVSEEFSDQMEYAIGHCKLALDTMRRLVRKKGFMDKQSEIHFFKQLKPCVYSKLLYYQLLRWQPHRNLTREPRQVRFSKRYCFFLDKWIMS